MAETTARLDYSKQPFGVDVSRYQGRIDWNQMVNGPIKVRFAAIRLGISWGYTDPWFAHNWTESKRVGCPRMAYHVLYPGEAIQPQIDLIAKQLGTDKGDLPFVADIELQHGRSPAEIRTASYEYVMRIQDLIQRAPIIYSRAQWIDTYLIGNSTPPDWLNQFPWWLALYLNSGLPHPGPVTAPKGVSADKVYIHQVGDHTPSLGFGINQADSKQLDYNRWLKSEDALLALANQQPPANTNPLIDWLGNQLYETQRRYEEDQKRNAELSNIINQL